MKREQHQTRGGPSDRCSGTSQQCELAFSRRYWSLRAAVLPAAAGRGELPSEEPEDCDRLKARHMRCSSSPPTTCSLIGTLTCSFTKPASPLQLSNKALIEYAISAAENSVRRSAVHKEADAYHSDERMNHKTNPSVQNWGLLRLIWPVARCAFLPRGICSYH